MSRIERRSNRLGLKYADESCSTCRALLLVQASDEAGNPKSSAACLHGLWQWLSWSDAPEKLTEHLKSAVDCDEYSPMQEQPQARHTDAKAEAPAELIEAFRRIGRKLGG